MNERAKILIVDDSPNNLQVLISILERFKYEIRPALSGEIALMAIDTFIPDLILLDDVMPGEISGLQFLEKIHAIKDMENIPIIMLTANDNADSVMRALMAGAVDYILKPFDSEKFVKKINFVDSRT